jgi:hypothetical protein
VEAPHATSVAKKGVASAQYAEQRSSKTSSDDTVQLEKSGPIQPCKALAVKIYRIIVG